jgi:hypothetical protein
VGIDVVADAERVDAYAAPGTPADELEDFRSLRQAGGRQAVGQQDHLEDSAWLFSRPLAERSLERGRDVGCPVSLDVADPRTSQAKLLGGG